VGYESPSARSALRWGFFVSLEYGSIHNRVNRMVKSLSTLAALAAFAVVGFAAQSAQAQGCCKAGLCRIPTLPSSPSASASMLQPQMDAQMAYRSVGANSAATNGTAMNGATLAQFSLSNPSDSRSSVEYVLSGKSYTLEPGMTLTFNTSQPRKIEFKRSGETVAAYRVSRGSYEFSQNGNGWELYRLAAR
jgi:hypothetical protein